MKHRGITGTLFLVAAIGGVCFIASMMVLGLVSERQGRLGEVKQEIASSWGGKQILSGPFLVVPSRDPKNIPATIILPTSLSVKATLVPEVRSRGIFDVVVYGSSAVVSGTFARADLDGARFGGAPVTLAVLLSDTRGIDKVVDLSWDGVDLTFVPGPGIATSEGSGFHALVPATGHGEVIPFAFTFPLKGSEGFAVAPLGDETHIALDSTWATPKFSGEFLPSTRTISDTGFTAEWTVSSFGRSYPRTWAVGEVELARLSGSSAGVELSRAFDPYDPVERSIKYAIIFLVVTFSAFFLFDVLVGVRVHPVSYLLVGAALALFFLLLLSFTEHIGFPMAYLLGATMTVALITGYASKILKSPRRALPLALLLVLLYGYLYFVLRLEDYALLFGALLLFVFLAVLMYATRKIDWFALDRE